MPNNLEKKYLLAIKRGKNDFLPLEWQFTSFYNGEDLTSLEGIDTFTKRITRMDLLLEAVNLNMINIDERYTSFSIIYSENNKYHELKESCIFAEDINIFDANQFIYFIINNIDNKDILNQIYNLCTGKIEEQKLIEFKFILKNLELFRYRGKNALLAALDTFKSISYINQRSILIKVSKKVITPILEKEDNKSLTKKSEIEGKVA